MLNTNKVRWIRDLKDHEETQNNYKETKRHYEEMRNKKETKSTTRRNKNDHREMQKYEQTVEIISFTSF